MTIADDMKKKREEKNVAEGVNTGASNLSFSDRMKNKSKNKNNVVSGVNNIQKEENVDVVVETATEESSTPAVETINASTVKEEPRQAETIISETASNQLSVIKHNMAALRESTRSSSKVVIDNKEVVDLKGFIEGLKPKDDRMYELQPLKGDVRSMQVVGGLGAKFSLPHKHCLHMYNGINILVNNTLTNPETMRKFIQEMLDNDKKTRSVYMMLDNVPHRVLTDSEIQTIIMASEGAFTEVKEEHVAGGVAYHVIATI